jgi:COP9 signalosome complex subunit 3
VNETSDVGASSSDGSAFDASDNSSSASAQVRKCPSAFAEVSGAFAACALAEGSAGSALAAVAPLRAATRAARPTRDHLTKQHAFLFSACVACGRHDVVAADVDSCPVFETDPIATGVDAMDYLKYCDLGGTALLSLGRYADAAELFLRATTAPATAPAAAHASAHKKYVLCSLLAEGACAFASSLPKYASPAVQRHVRGACAAYASFAEAYATGSVAAARARFAESREAFDRDGKFMTRLAETALGSLHRRAVRKLTETHISSSLADIACDAQLTGGEAEAERVVLEMIDAREIYAKIDASTRSVTFLDAADDPFAAEEEAAALAGAVAEARALAERVRRKDDTLRASRAYVNATADLVSSGPAGGKAKPEEGKRIPGDADGDGEEDD